MSFTTKTYFDRDVPLDDSGSIIFRGNFPSVNIWPTSSYATLRQVKNGFRNLTDLNVPASVSALLSFGPKFMLPSFTLMSSLETKSMWAGLLDELEKAGYATVQYPIEHASLKDKFDEHVGDDNMVSRMSRKILIDAHMTDEFLRQHHRHAVLVEGDKGKVVGLMPRVQLIKLIKCFIDEGLSCGRYQEFMLANEATFLKSIEPIYLDVIAPFNRLSHSGSTPESFLFIILRGSTATQCKVIHSLNAYARSLLVHVSWAIPSFRPTIKFHKDPVKIRPVISKRGTPSINVGKVVRLALERVMMNYFLYDEKLNVLRVEDLTEELFGIYRSDPSYGFCSIDVVSMFDRISMDGVRDIIKSLDMRIPGGAVNTKLLLLLVKLDCDFFDFFKYIVPDGRQIPTIHYYHQRQGIFMGGNTSTLYSDLYMSYHISKLSPRLKGLGVLLIRKYVDDMLIYAPRQNLPQIVSLIQCATNLEYTIEYPVDGRLPYLDLMIQDVGGVLTTTWYRKSISSERLVNFHSSVPSHELINTFTIRFVVACRYDSGGGFLQSFHVILNEMYWNSVPRRLVRLCLNRSRRYFLGRRGEHKRFWLSILATEVYHLSLGEVSFDDFSVTLERLYHHRGYDPDQFYLEDDVRGVCQFRKHPVRQFHVPGDPISILPYRGRQSVRVFKELRTKYTACTTVFRHDRYYSIRRLTRHGLEYRHAKLRKAKRKAKLNLLK